MADDNLRGDARANEIARVGQRRLETDDNYIRRISNPIASAIQRQIFAGFHISTLVTKALEKTNAGQPENILVSRRQRTLAGADGICRIYI